MGRVRTKTCRLLEAELRFVHYMTVWCAYSFGTLHNVQFVKYDVTVSFYDAVSDTIRRRVGDRGIFTEEGVDTVAYFGGNHGFRV